MEIATSFCGRTRNDGRKRGSHWVIHEQPMPVNAYIAKFVEGTITSSP
jgi:hypothetical protein